MGVAVVLTKYMYVCAEMSSKIWLHVHIFYSGFFFFFWLLSIKICFSSTNMSINASKGVSEVLSQKESSLSDVKESLIHKYSERR